MHTRAVSILALVAWTGTAIAEAVAPQSATREERLIRVEISTSRSEVTSAGGYGVFADLQNLGTDPVLLRNTETTLVIQPELVGDHNCIFEVDGFYPTEDVISHDGSKYSQIVLQPNEHYVAFWDISNRNGECTDSTSSAPIGDSGTGHTGSAPTSSGATGSAPTPELTLPTRSGASRSSAVPPRAWPIRLGNYFLERISFVPGNYSFVVVGKAYRVVSGKPQAEYHTYTDQTKLHVGLTQIDAMVAAMLGGLLAYFVSALRPQGDFDKFGAKEGTATAWNNFRASLVVLRGLASACLISGAVTIVLSRISDTQFPIKVSVADFWGALTIGFIAFFIGDKLIDRIVGFASQNTIPPGQGKVAPVPPETPPAQATPPGR